MKIIQQTIFKTTDGTIHENRQAAESWQDFIDFRDWCDNEFTTGLSTRGADVAEEIWKYYNVTPK